MAINFTTKIIVRPVFLTCVKLGMNWNDHFRAETTVSKDVNSIKRAVFKVLVAVFIK